jgi:integrase
MLKALGIRYRRPYQCRHTYATVMLHAKMNPAMCAKQLGHDVKVFLTIYAKWIEGEADDREMALLEQQIAPTPGAKEMTR